MTRAHLQLAVQHAVRAADSPRRPALMRWLKAAVTEDAEITVRFVNTEEGQSLNRDFRGRDYPTNVLTFTYGSDPWQGDLVLCVPVVEREAREQGKALEAHYAHLIIHGALHLQGYDHENEADAIVMEALETRILESLGYPDPYLADRLAGEAS